MRAFTILLLFSYFVFLSCEDSLGEISYECTFEQIDENKDGIIDDIERALMNQCKLTGFDTKGQVEENLLGEWILVGHGEGSTGSISQPCARLSISEEELVFKINNASLNSETTHSWEIEIIESLVGDYFKLQVEPSGPVNLAFNNFCENYMYVDNTGRHGYMYLYKKIE